MKKLSLAIAILAAGVVAAGPLTHYANSAHANPRTVPTTIQADLPIPPCVPGCALPMPSPIPD